MNRPITAEDIRRGERELERRSRAFQTEFVKPLIKRTFEIMRERGLIPEEPKP